MAGGHQNDIRVLNEEFDPLQSRYDDSADFDAIETSTEPPVNAQTKQRKAAKISIFAFIILFTLETSVQGWIDVNGKVLKGWLSLNGHPKSTEFNQQSKTSVHNSSLHQDHYAGYYSIDDAIKIEYEQWHKLVRNLSQMELQPSNWMPVVNWDNHPKERSDRFPSIHERVQYYMGKWHNATISMFGRDFEKATYIQRKTTREYGPLFSDILVNLYNLDKDRLLKCYRNKKEHHVSAPYCRDYIDIAILHSKGTANVLHNIGDGLPYVPEEIRKYPLFAKVRPFCNHGDEDSGDIGFVNNLCKRKYRVEPILLPLNRKRHFGVASTIPENDVPWEKKLRKAVWRGQYGKTHDTLSDTNDIKYALVSRHRYSTLVDAKFSKHTADAPLHMTGSYMDIKDQLRYKYVISIEGNDVSSGLKWMLFSNSVVLTPQFTWESWAMEGKLKPFQHYIPLNADMSNVEEMIKWAEAHPEETRMIAERSTLFIYDLLFHHNAIDDEKRIMMSIMERFEQNFGSRRATKEKGVLGIQWDKHPTDRVLRFPSVDERVRYVMGKWYHNDNALSMKRSEIKHLPHELRNSDISKNDLFVADGHKLSTCAMANSTFSKDIRLSCQSSLPDFDERNTADLKSNSFNRLRKTQKGKGIKLSITSSWRHDEKGMKESKRVLLDESIKLLCYGGCLQSGVNAPFFASTRRKDGVIVWPFGIEDTVDIVKSNWIEGADKDFEDKQPRVFWRNEVNSRNKAAALVSSKFVFGSIETARDDKYGFSRNFFAAEEASKRKDRIRKMLSYRYLLAKENDAGIGGDLLWMLLSQSVVLMPADRQVTTWLLEGFLKPFTHYIPVESDYSDIDEKIRWSEGNLEEVKMISERASLFVYDMLLGRAADKDNEEVKFQVMERYSKLFG